MDNYTQKLIKVFEGDCSYFQPSLSVYTNAIPGDTALGLSPGIAQVSNTARHIKECEEASWSFYYRCPGCGRKTVTIGHCFIRYCSHCMPSKKGRAVKRLKDPMAGFPDVVTHLILTIPTTLYSKASKKFIENAKRKLFQSLRRRGMRFSAVSVVDYGNPKGEDPLETNLHIHNALDMPYSFYLSPSFLQKQWAKATGISNAVVRAKKSKKSAVIRYFAKRIAGDFGHGKYPILFEDLMTVGQYDGLVKGSRCMTLSFPKGNSYSCKRSANASQKQSKICEICGEELLLEAVMFKSTLVWGEFG